MSNFLKITIYNKNLTISQNSQVFSKKILKKSAINNCLFAYCINHKLIIIVKKKPVTCVNGYLECHKKLICTNFKQSCKFHIILCEQLMPQEAYF